MLDASSSASRRACGERGYSTRAIKALWDVLVPFSDYAFNKAHSAAYGLVSYWTAYLKANYPAEYMAALLTSSRDDKDKSALYLNECRRMGIKVLPPDVNESDADFTPRGTDIRFGLSAIRNVGATSSRRSSRPARPRASSPPSRTSCDKVAVGRLQQADHRVADQGGRVRLARAHPQGPRSPCTSRPSTPWSRSSARRPTGQVRPLRRPRRRRAATPASALDVAVPDGGVGQADLLAYEREMLGLYVSDHPLFGVEHVLPARPTARSPSSPADDGRPDGAVVTIGGIISGLQRKMTKQGNAWAIATVEDLDGRHRGACSSRRPTSWSSHAARRGRVVLVKGRLDKREDVPTLIAHGAHRPGPVRRRRRGPVVDLACPVARCTPPVVERLSEVLAPTRAPPRCTCGCRQPGRDHGAAARRRLRVTPDPALFGDLKALLGPGCLV